LLKVSVRQKRLFKQALCVLFCLFAVFMLVPAAVSASVRLPGPDAPSYNAAFAGPSQFTIDGTFTDWGSTGAPAQGVALQLDTNTGTADGSGFAGKAEDIDYFWQATSTQNGTSPASSPNPIQNFYYRFDTISGGAITGSKYWVQLNLGQAAPGQADHILEFYVASAGSPQVIIVMYPYSTPYPSMRAFTAGLGTNQVSNIAGHGTQDTNATGGYGLVSGTNYGFEVKIPVGWFGSTYGGNVNADGSGSPVIGAVFTSNGSQFAIGTVKDTLNNSSGNTVVSSANTSTGNISFVDSTITKLAFTTAAQNIAVNTASSVITVQTQDADSLGETVAANTTVNLTSTSGTGVFSLSATTWVDITSVTIAINTSSTSFYYKDTAAGLPTITAASGTLTSATQTETVGVTKLVFTTIAQSIAGNTASGIMTIQAQDAGSVARNLSASVTVDLTSNSTYGLFSSDGTNFNITSVTIPAGSSSVSFYYKDTRAGTPTITAAENPSLGWTDATQQETITGTIAITNSPGSYGFGVINTSTTNPTGLAYFTVTNTGNVIVVIIITATDMTGGVTWTLADNAGANIYALRAGLSSYNITVKKTPTTTTLVATLNPGAAQTWGLQFLAPISFSDGASKSGTITLAATAY